MKEIQQNSRDFDAPAWQELDEGLYDALIRQLQYQRSTISLLHLQLKQQNGSDVAKALEEKDRLIFSLEKKVQEQKDAAPSEASSEVVEKLQAEIQELEQDWETDRRLLAAKNEEIREIQRKYNDHLNDLHQEKVRLENELKNLKNGQGNLNEDSAKELKESRARILELQSELQLAQQQVQFQKQRNADNKPSEDTQKLRQELSLSEQSIEELQKILEEKEASIRELQKNLSQASGEDQLEERLMVENETLRNKIATLKEELTEARKAPRGGISTSDTGAATEFEDLELLVRLYEETSQGSSSDLKHLVMDLCRRHGLEPYDCLGEIYDSSRHHMVETVYSTELTHSTVFREVRKGFLKGNEVFRKADIALSQNPMMCKSCNTQNKDDSRFCFHCGSRLNMADIETSSQGRVIDDGENARAYLDLGHSYLIRRELKLAMDSFHKASILHPDNLEALKGMALVQEACGDYPQCREILRELEKLAGGDSCAREIERRIQYKVQVMEALQRIL